MKYLGLFVTIILILVAYMGFKNNQTPNGLGVKNGVFKSLSEKPNGVSTQAENPEKRVAPIPFKINLAVSKRALLDAAQAYGGCEIVKDEGSYIYMVFTTGTMKYKDDVELYFDEANRQVEYRSESRIGYSDMGLNRARYEAIVDTYMSFKEAK